jgi:hypothetical protein
MTTDICPACGYPTLSPALCAFCRPGDVSPATAVHPVSADFRDLDARSVDRPFIWSNPLAS